jgi:hypothetical protein
MNSTSTIAIDWILEEIEEYGNSTNEHERDDALFDIAGIVLAAIASIPDERRISSFKLYTDSQQNRNRPELAFHEGIRRIVHASESERLMMLHMLAKRSVERV